MAKKNGHEETTAMTQDTGTKALTQFEYGDDDVGAGFENQTKDDTVVPFIILLQPLSPQVLENKVSSNGLTLTAGMFFHTVTEQAWPASKGFLFVPSTTKHEIVEWAPREGGGGFVARHAIESEVFADAIKKSEKFGKYKTDAGNVLQDTFYIYGVICDEAGQPEGPAVISFWSTKIRAYKSFMTRVKGQMVPIRVKDPATGADMTKKVRPPLYANLARMTSELKKFDTEKGPAQAFVPIITAGDPRGVRESLLSPDDDRFVMAKACRELVDSGMAKVDYSKAQGGEDQADGSRDIPF